MLGVTRTVRGHVRDNDCISRAQLVEEMTCRDSESHCQWDYCDCTGGQDQTSLLLNSNKEWKEALAAADVSFAFSKADTDVVKTVLRLQSDDNTFWLKLSI